MATKKITTPKPDYKQMATEFAVRLGMSDKDLRRYGLKD